MGSGDDIRSAIETLFYTVWVTNGGNDAGTIAWHNMGGFEPPAGDGVWVQPTILFGDGSLFEMSGDNMIEGVFHVNLFRKRGEGTGALIAKADTIRTGFNRVESGGVRFGVASGAKPNFDVRQGPVFPAGDYFQAGVSIPFEYFES